MELTKTGNGNFFCPDDPGEECYDKIGPRLSVTGRECEALGAAARNRMVLEIGTGVGVSTRAMAGKARWMVTVDTDPWVHKVVWAELKKKFPDLVCSENVLEDREIFDMAFVDGDHRYDAVKKDIETCRRVCRPFAPIFLHDYMGDVRDAALASGFVECKSWGEATNLVVGMLK